MCYGAVMKQVIDVTVVMEDGREVSYKCLTLETSYRASGNTERHTVRACGAREVADLPKAATDPASRR